MLVLISGPSGAGKSTFVKSLLETDDRLEFSISTTTRPPREGEIDGVHYNFVDDDAFDRLIAADAFVEWAPVHKQRYGTQKADLQRMIDAGRVPLLDLDVQGGKNVIGVFGEDLVSVFIVPPSWPELERRLRTRDTDDDAVIATRLENARWEVDFAKYYRYLVINDDLDEALVEMRAILLAEECRRDRRKMPLV